MLIFDFGKFATDVTTKRQAESLSFRQAARKADVASENTIKRAEHGEGVNIENFTRICQWLKVEPGQYFKQETT